MKTQIVGLLCYMGVFHITGIVFRLCVPYFISMIYLTCMSYVTGIGYVLNVEVLCQIGAIRPICLVHYMDTTYLYI